jgi:MYXO-CTERM domain-containing protein
MSPFLVVLALLAPGDVARDCAVDRPAPVVMRGGDVDLVTPRPIGVVVHILTTPSGREAASDEEAIAVVEALDAGHRDNGSPFEFTLAAIDRVEVPESDLVLVMGTATESRLARTGDEEDLHIYLVGVDCRSTEGGWAYYPPGTNNAVFVRAGRGLRTREIAVHEVGHWLGLDHVHQDGCAAPGDGVDDTPAQLPPPRSTADRCAPDYQPVQLDCEAAADTCPDAAGVDTPDNYMSYWAGCQRAFTPGQVERMLATWLAYRDPARTGGKADEGELAPPPAACAVRPGAGPGAPAWLALLALVGLLRARRPR